MGRKCSSKQHQEGKGDRASPVDAASDGALKKKKGTWTNVEF